MNSHALFTEKQRFNQWWIWAILISVNAVMLFGLAQQMVFKKPFGENPASDGGIIFGAFMCSLLLIVFVSFRLETRIYKGGKLIREEWHYPESLDLIFRAIEGIRIIQPMGGIKYVKDDIDDLVVQTIEEIEPTSTIWIFHRNDWIDTSTGELLTGYEPSRREFEYSKRIRTFVDH